MKVKGHCYSSGFCGVIREEFVSQKVEDKKFNRYCSEPTSWMVTWLRWLKYNIKMDVRVKKGFEAGRWMPLVQDIALWLEFVSNLFNPLVLLPEI